MSRNQKHNTDDKTFLDINSPIQENYDQCVPNVNHNKILKSHTTNKC